MKKYKFPCGCEFDLNENGGIIIREHEFNPNCPEAYRLVQEGRTIGCFQIESQLLIKWSKDIKPMNLDEMCDLVAIVRPGTLKSIFKIIKDGDKFKEISAAEWYVMVKNKQVPIEFFHPSLEPVLSKTNGIMLFQEQMLQIAVLIAAFNEIEADLLRRGIGKKKAEIVAECKKLFIEKAVGVGILTKEQAEELFHQIEAANRYSFNKSHSYCYGVTAYESAYYKAHFPLEFFCSSLRLAIEDQDAYEQMARIVRDAKRHGFEVYPPFLADKQENFYVKENGVAFGLVNIKGMGNSGVTKIIENIEKIEKYLNKNIYMWNWFECLVNFTVPGENWKSIGVSNIELLIKSGALDNLEVPRKKMLFELTNWDQLSDGEKKWIWERQKDFNNLYDSLKAVAKLKKDGGGCHDARRLGTICGIIKIIEKPPTKLNDTVLSITTMETATLGISLSCSIVEACDTSGINCTVEEFYQNKPLRWFILGVECKRVNITKVKNGQSKGKDMAFLSFEDSTGTLDDCVIFSEDYEQFNDLLLVGNTVMIEGQRDKNKGSFIVKKVSQI